MLAAENIIAPTRTEKLARAVIAGLRRAMRGRTAFSPRGMQRRAPSGPERRPYELVPVSGSQPWPGSEYDKTDLAQTWASLFSPERP